MQTTPTGTEGGMISIGSFTQNFDPGSIILGNYGWVNNTNTYGIVIGNGATIDYPAGSLVNQIYGGATSTQVTIIGNQSFAYVAPYASAYGYDSWVNQAIGGTALGYEANVNKGASYSTSVGYNASSKENALGSTMVGANAVSTAQGGVALGNGAVSDKNGSVALGSGFNTNEVLVSNNEAFTNLLNTANAGVVSIGDKIPNNIYGVGKVGNINYRRLTYLAGGINDTDATNVRQVRTAEYIASNRVRLNI